MPTPEFRLLTLLREVEKVAGQLDPLTRIVERGELLIVAARMRAVYQKLTSKSG